MSQIKEIFEKLPSVFNAEAAKGKNIVFQYDITGEGGGQWQVIVNDGKCEVKEGVHPNPSVTLTMDAENYLAMAAKKLKPTTAYMTGKLKIKGNIFLAQKFAEFFRM
ncbi:MAG: SCP2 sterol-binding domain-containing protein [Verrucomicrobia bacterium]|nr:SCP2 sterol-binding domain-containing protein [Verrucomicrobiota bacterium]